MTQDTGRTISNRKAIGLLAGFIVLLAVIVFRDVFFTGQLLLTTDDNFGELVARKSGLPQGFRAWWYDGQLVGFPGVVNICWTYLLLWLLPAGFYANWIHAIDLGFASFFLALFLRERGCRWPSCAVALLAAFWVGSNFTLTYAGHIGKFGVLVFAGLYLWLAERAVRRKSIPYAVLAGGAMGTMLLEQPDVGLFFAMPLGLYTVYAILRDYGLNKSVLLRIILPLVFVAGLTAFRSVSAGYSTKVSGTTMAETEDPQAKWAFATQWSWPPEESIDFIAPGFMGWRSHEPDGPYWGRMGRSAGWEESEQGFRNFKLESQYLGAIPVLLAVWACFAGWWFRKERKGASPDIFFWGAVALITLLLSFGKHFPLYRVFYLLPGMSSIRNPNKFLQIFQVAMAILAAYGFETLLDTGLAEKVRALPRNRIKKVVLGVAVVGALMGIVALVFGATLHDVVTRAVANGWGAQAESIVRLRIQALAYGAAMTLFVAGLLAYVFLGGGPGDRRGRQTVIALVVGLMLLDVLMLNRHYVRTMDTSMFEDNPALQVLQQNLQGQRAALLTQESFYNQWLTYLFPYYHISSINVPQMPRMAADYQRFLSTVGRQSLRFWQLAAVGFVMGPYSAWEQFQQSDELKDIFELVYRFNVASDGKRLHVIPHSDEQPGQHCILRFRAPASRYTLISNWEVAEDDAVLRELTEGSTPLLSKVWISPDTAGGLTPSQSEQIQGNIRRISYRMGRVNLQVSTDQPAILRFSDKYDPGWQAMVNGEPAPVLRCDYLFTGVHLKPGLHDVVLEYRPDVRNTWTQFLAFALCLVALGMVVREEWVGRAVGDVQPEKPGR